MPTDTLHEPSRHEPLTATAWDATVARAAIAAIVADIEGAALGGGSHWPVHPDDDDGPAPSTGFKSVYLGSAGVLWALWWLGQAGAVRLSRLDPVAAIRALPDAYLADPDTGTVVPSYFLGEAGILLLHWKLTGDRSRLDRLHDSMAANVDNPTNESLWAAPGTHIAAWELVLATGEARWRALCESNLERMWSTWEQDPAGRWLWTQDMYGRRSRYLGAGHGLAGNLYALLKSLPLLDEARRQVLFDRAAGTLAATALRVDRRANWAPEPEVPPGLKPKRLMQWCHGAPGIVTSLAAFPSGRSPVVDELLLAAGEAVWHAGPLAKGAGICHGTAGNGHALLALHARTGEALWLERARAFAMHALEQVARARERHGRGRYTLWTGDAGVAVYLWHCIQGSGGLPAWDVLG